MSLKDILQPLNAEPLDLSTYTTAEVILTLQKEWVLLVSASKQFRHELRIFFFNPKVCYFAAA